MKLAITVWDERISPVFDSANTLLIATIKSSEIKNISYKSFDPSLSAKPAEQLKLLDISVLICGAVSQSHAVLIEAKNIKLIPFITGDVNRILELYAAGNSIVPDFLMPGCKKDRFDT